MPHWGGPDRIPEFAPEMADEIVAVTNPRGPRVMKGMGVAMSNDQTDADKLLTPAEVAAMFRVNAKTVTRWARSGRLSAIKTMGGHRRYRLSEVRRAVEAIGTDA
jgi:excisionase family DNA binding protein